jgi:hypothetical protein
MRKMEKQMNKLENKIETHKENLKVLRAEWIYLTSVDRIKNVIQKNNLDFKILNSKDYVSIEEIPYDFESIKRRPDPVKIMQTYYIKEQ